MGKVKADKSTFSAYSRLWHLDSLLQGWHLVSLLLPKDLEVHPGYKETLLEGTRQVLEIKKPIK